MSILATVKNYNGHRALGVAVGVTLLGREMPVQVFPKRRLNATGLLKVPMSILLKLIDFLKTEYPSRKRYILKMPVLQLRLRNTRSVRLGFRKYVWKKVWLVLREDFVELYKEADDGPLHCKLKLEAITRMTLLHDSDACARGAAEDWHMINGFSLGTLEFSAASVEEARGFIYCLAHNQNMNYLEKTDISRIDAISPYMSAMGFPSYDYC